MLGFIINLSSSKEIDYIIIDSYTTESYHYYILMDKNRNTHKIYSDCGFSIKNTDVLHLGYDFTMQKFMES
jgi:hypothetical protein